LLCVYGEISQRFTWQPCAFNRHGSAIGKAEFHSPFMFIQRNGKPFIVKGYNPFFANDAAVVVKCTGY